MCLLLKSSTVSVHSSSSSSFSYNLSPTTTLLTSLPKNASTYSSIISNKKIFNLSATFHLKFYFILNSDQDPGIGLVVHEDVHHVAVVVREVRKSALIDRDQIHVIVVKSTHTQLMIIIDKKRAFFEKFFIIKFSLTFFFLTIVSFFMFHISVEEFVKLLEVNIFEHINYK